MYKLYDGLNFVKESENLKEIYKKAFDIARKKSSYYIREFSSKNKHLFDYGSHFSFVKIESDKKEEDMALSIAKIKEIGWAKNSAVF